MIKRSEELPVNISLRGGTLKQVSFFKYLEDLVCDDRKCDSDIRPRIGMTKTAFGQIRKFMTSLSINIEQG